MLQYDLIDTDHATLASAYVLFNELGVESHIEFITQRVGRLTVLLNAQNEIEMTFPNQKPEAVATVPPALFNGLSKKPIYDFVSRYFWPANGGDEDPVTGSIHAGLAPYWAEKLNKPDLVAYQASKRGGILKCRVSETTVVVSGKGVLYLKGKINI